MKIRILFTLLSISTLAFSQVEKLQGTWKIENKESFEVWSIENDSLSGYSYNFKEGQKIITETLSIKKVNGQYIYEATVPNQNKGNTIPFLLKSSNASLLSFENAEHDFPQKIQYQFISDSEIEVSVLGEKDKGFSFKLIRQ